MSSAKLTIIGFDDYFVQMGQSLFDNLTLPEGITKDTLIDNIILEGGEFEVMYSDPDFMRRAIGAWSLKWYPSIERWIKALAIEYNPLENYDRMEDWTDNIERSEAASTEDTLSRDEAADFSQSDARQTGGDNTITTDRDSLNSPPKRTIERSAYDSNNYEPSSQETETGKWKEINAQNTSESGATSSEGNTRISETGRGSSSSALNDDSVHSGRIHGNIGVTTSQQMLMQELEIGYWNIYEKVTELFLKEFTIPVYI